MPKEYSQHLLNAAAFSQEFGETFAGIQFDQRTQAVEVFVLQALAMCSSHCQAAAMLLKNGFKGESVTVLRTVQELLFDLHWIQQAQDRNEQLERAYQLEADPYSRWFKETLLIEKAGIPETAQRWREPIDAIAAEYPFLTLKDSSGKVQFKSAPSFADRMGVLRSKFYHVYRYSSLFSHPTPTVKRLYLEISDSGAYQTDSIDESIRQFVAYALLFVEFIMGIAGEVIGPFAAPSQQKRDSLYRNAVELVKISNRGYFRNPEEPT